jgi:hypothetical protein
MFPSESLAGCHVCMPEKFPIVPDSGDLRDFVDWLNRKSQVANGVTIAREFWDEAEQGWRSFAFAPLRATGAQGARYLRYSLKWGPKLGHFAEGHTLREAFNNARARDP